MNELQIKEKRQHFLTLADQAIKFNAMTLASHGVDQEFFAGVVREAILANPDVLQAEEKSFAQAIRKCCLNNIIPDGDYGAIVVFGTQAVAMPMVQGIKRMAVEQLDAELHYGAVYEGDDVEIVTGVGVTPYVKVLTTGTDVFTQRKGENVIGAWCSIKLPSEEHPRITIYTKDEIARARNVSRAKNGPWKTWPERMAVKSCVKSAVWDLRYLASAKARAAKMFKILEEDNTAEYEGATIEYGSASDAGRDGEAVDAEFEVVAGNQQQAEPAPAQVETKPVEKAPAPAPETPAAKPANTQQEDPRPAFMQENPPQTFDQTAPVSTPTGEGSAGFLPGIPIAGGTTDL